MTLTPGPTSANPLQVPATPVAQALTPAPAAPLTPDELREVKVKLPLDQVLRLHLARMKKRESVSKIVSSALSRYFDEFNKA